MLSAIYIEEAIREHPRVQAILAKYAKLPQIECRRFSEVFNRRNQNFRIQKQAPALILAQKHGKHVLKAPELYHIGGQYNYYFSHMLNCLYDCRYCFLQGMFQSAHYVLFVNYEDYADAIIECAASHPDERSYYFSGYDCDSLAFEPVSGFAEYFLPLFKQHSNAVLELRTKSTQVRKLYPMEPMDNVVVAFSFTPNSVATRWEAQVPSVSKRIEAMVKLAQQGWRIGLRFDPLIYHQDYLAHYAELFKEIFTRLPNESIHSVSLGLFRLPESFYKSMWSLYPDEPLFAAGLSVQTPADTKGKMVSYAKEIEASMLDACETLLLNYIDKARYFPCF